MNKNILLQGCIRFNSYSIFFKNFSSSSYIILICIIRILLCLRYCHLTLEMQDDNNGKSNAYPILITGDKDLCEN